MAIKVLTTQTIAEIGLDLINFIMSIKGEFKMIKQPDDTFWVEYCWSLYGSDASYQSNVVCCSNRVMTPIDAALITGNIPEFIYSQLKAKYNLTDNTMVVDC